MKVFLKSLILTIRILRNTWFYLLFALLVIPVLLAAEETDSLLLTGCTIHTMGPQDMIDSGYVKLESGRITATGQLAELAPGDHGTRIDLDGAHLLPGFIDIHALMQGETFSDGISIPTGSEDYILSTSTVKSLLSKGITVLVLRNASEETFQGSSQVIQLRPQSEGGPFVMANSFDYQINLTGGGGSHNTPADVYERLGHYYRLRERLTSARSDRRTLPSGPGTLPEASDRGGLPGNRLYLQIYDLYDVERIGLLTREREWAIMFSGPVNISFHGDFSGIRSHLKESVFVINPVALTSPEVAVSDRDFLSLFEAHDVRYAVASFRPVTSHPGLLSSARRLMSFGVSGQKALESITQVPGIALRSAEQLGYIGKGVRANLVAFDGPPARVTSKVILTIADGRPVWISDQRQ